MLSGRAGAEGITTFTALMLATNRAMMELFEQLDPMRIVDQSTGTVEIEVPIPPIGVAPALRQLFGSRPNTMWRSRLRVATDYLRSAWHDQKNAPDLLRHMRPEGDVVKGWSFRSLHSL